MSKEGFTVEKGTKIIIGYRSLIDWYKSRGNSISSWGVQARKAVTNPVKWAQTGPMSTPTKKGNKLPGAKGAAWGVKGFDVPTGGIRKHSEIKEIFGDYVPQWVYMTAEHLLQDSQGLSPSKLKSMKKPVGGFVRKDIKTEKKEYRDDPDKFEEERSGESIYEMAWRAIPRGVTKVDLSYAKTFGEATLKNMGNKEGIPQLFGYLRDNINEKFEKNEDTLYQIYEGTSWDMESIPGQTGQEYLAYVAGAGEAEEDAKYGGEDVHSMLGRLPDPSGRRAGSNPVDIKFDKSVKVKGKDLKFTRADVTSASYSASKGHHGIGPKSKRVDDLSKTIKEREKIIMGQNNKRIGKFNEMITTLHSLYGTSDAVVLRRKIAQERLGKAKWHLPKSYFSPPPKTKKQLNDRIAAIKTKTKANFDKELATALGVEVDGAFKETIEWVLHALGNHVVDEEYWANIMSIDMADGSLGTLILRYSFLNDGQFQKLKRQDVIILEHSVERFIFNQGEGDKSDIAFMQALERVNANITTEGYSAISAETNLMRLQGSGTRIRQTAHLAMPVAGEFAERMDAWTFALVDDIVKDAEHKMNKDFKDNAVKFSRSMRNDGQLGKVRNWMSAIYETFLGATVDASSVPLGFMWNAPYISSMEKQPGGGGANQFQGTFK